MLLVWRVVQPNGDEDEEDEEGPDDLHKKLQLRIKQEVTHTVKQEAASRVQDNKWFTTDDKFIDSP